MLALLPEHTVPAGGAALGTVAVAKPAAPAEQTAVGEPAPVPPEPATADRTPGGPGRAASGRVPSRPPGDQDARQATNVCRASVATGAPVATRRAAPASRTAASSATAPLTVNGSRTIALEGAVDPEPRAGRHPYAEPLPRLGDAGTGEPARTRPEGQPAAGNAELPVGQVPAQRRDERVAVLAGLVAADLDGLLPAAGLQQPGDGELFEHR